MKKILITGGAGYIGSFTAHEFVKSGYDVNVVDNLFRGHRESLPSEVNFHNADLTDLKATENIFKNNKFELVLHLAALAFVKESVEKPDLYLNNNIRSTENIIFLAKKYNVQKIIFSSSCTIYGNINANKLLSEESPFEPINPYGVSKVRCEELIRESGLDYLVLRYFNVAGADLELRRGHRTDFTSHLIHTLSRSAILNKPVLINGNGRHVRDYIHVKDVAFIHKLAAEYILTNSCGDLINCGYGRGFSVLEIVDYFEKSNKIKINKEFVNFRTGDPEYLVCNNTKLTTMLGWKSKFTEPLLDICNSSYNWEKYFLTKI